MADLGLAAQVGFLPATNRAGVANAIRTHDFLAHLERDRNLSLVTLEALACGVPVLSTACGGPQDLITQPWLGSIIATISKA